MKNPVDDHNVSQKQVWSFIWLFYIQTVYMN